MASGIAESNTCLAAKIIIINKNKRLLRVENGNYYYYYFGKFMEIFVINPK